MNHIRFLTDVLSNIIVQKQNDYSYRISMHICMCLEPLIMDNYQYFLVKAMVFPVVMYGCESWTMKKAERRTVDSF